MIDDEIAAKRDRIARLDVEEWRGWWWAVFTHRVRAPYDGEMADLVARARVLGIKTMV